MVTAARSQVTFETACQQLLSFFDNFLAVKIATARIQLFFVLAYQQLKQLYKLLRGFYFPW
jgi:hypothetical protein